ncbi:MAG: O-antigen ligase family protein [Bacteroidales bacterium]|nr:O-antigen ligase family protein [Bacteroidales bacterium]
MSRLTERLKQWTSKLSIRHCILVCVGLLLLLVNGVAVLKELPVIPLISAAALLVYLVIFHLDLAMYLMAFSTPFSIIISHKEIHLGLSLPAEAFMIAISLMFLFRILYDLRLDKKILTHPISIALYVYLIWMLLTCITSELPVVSFKFWASKLWFTTSCYWMLTVLIKGDHAKAIRFFNCYAAALAIVVIITTIKHGLSGFDKHYAHWVMSPFYNDHTAYGAVLAFFLPITACCFFLPKNNIFHKFFYASLTVLFALALYLSFSRAAWLSLIIAIGVWIVLKLHIKFSWLVVGGLIVGGLLYFYADDILYKMSRNSQDSSTSFVEHIKSMSNISTDASNVERLNRWNSAFSMIKERPVVGWGPGTYQFEYAPFQKSKYKTIISTNFGDGGNAHSEYIGPCAETGIPGALTVIVMFFMALYTGLRTYNHTKDPYDRLLALMMTLALITYFVHGTMNNFLDTDKLSLPFWGAFAVIVMTNIRMNSNALDPQAP